MIRTNDAGIERLPLHRAIIEGIERNLHALDQLSNRVPKINPSTAIDILFQEHKTLLIYQKEVAEVKGSLRAYLSLVTCNIKKEHLDEITDKLWDFTQRYNNPEVVSLLRKLRIKKPTTQK